MFSSLKKPSLSAKRNGYDSGEPAKKPRFKVVPFGIGFNPKVVFADDACDVVFAVAESEDEEAPEEPLQPNRENSMDALSNTAKILFIWMTPFVIPSFCFNTILHFIRSVGTTDVVIKPTVTAVLIIPALHAQMNGTNFVCQR